MAATAYHHLINHPGVRAERMLAEGTRVGVHDMIGLVVNGASVGAVGQSFPTLTRAQVFECPPFSEDHRAEIDTLLARQMSVGREA